MISVINFNLQLDLQAQSHIQKENAEVIECDLQHN